jgi:hypothetical protein
VFAVHRVTLLCITEAAGWRNDVHYTTNAFYSANQVGDGTSRAGGRNDKWQMTNDKLSGLWHHAGPAGAAAAGGLHSHAGGALPPVWAGDPGQGVGQGVGSITEP